MLCNMLIQFSIQIYKQTLNKDMYKTTVSPSKNQKYIFRSTSIIFFNCKVNNLYKTFQAVTPLRVVKSNTALKLKADEDFKDDDDIDRTAGDEWLFNGPGN